MSVMLVGTYTIIFLGSCSPIHCRVTVAFGGLLCVMISYVAGFGYCFEAGLKVAGVHNLMPFLLIGIGVDDMFVVCNAVDQTDINDSVKNRIIEAMKHAGPSITITSLTNALAFYFGATTSLIALRSFCVFACTCVIMLYLTVLTVFPWRAIPRAVFKIPAYKTAFILYNRLLFPLFTGFFAVQYYLI